MESNVHTYQLTQKNKTYILILSLIGNQIKFNCKSSDDSTVSVTKTYTLDTLKNLGSLFEQIQSPEEAIQLLHNALKVHKVKVIEEGSSIRLLFYIVENGIDQRVEIPLSEDTFINTDVAATEYNTEVMAQTQMDSSAFNSGEVLTTNEYAASTYTANIDTNAYNENELVGTQQEYLEQGTALQENAEFQTVAETNTLTDNIDLNQFTTTNVQDTLGQYDTSVNVDYTQNYSAQEALAQIDTSANMQEFTAENIATQDVSSTQFNFQEYQASTTTNDIPYTENQYTETNAEISNLVNSAPFEAQVSNYSAPYISPADDMTPIATTGISAEANQIDYNLENYTQNYSNLNNYEQQYQAVNTATTTTTANTITNIKKIEHNYKESDDRLVKLEDETNSLRNEHQEMQNKLSTLYDQVTAYKNKLENLQREKNLRELASLKAENSTIKQQLLELTNLKNESYQIRMLKKQLAEMDPLRRKAAELDSLKNQLKEMNTLKAKVAELSGIQNQLIELNTIKTQINKMNLEKKQKEEFEEKEKLRKKLQELEHLKSEYENEIKSLKETKTESVQEKTEIEKKEHIFEERIKQVSVKGDIIHNAEELELITRKINKSSKKLTLNLLYKATVDSDKAAAFHEKCDEAQSSLVLVETDKGKRFGGFTTCSWSGDCEDKKDENAFVFSLDKMAIYDNIPGEDAIGCYPKFGPIFLGCQIRIYDNAFTKGGSTFEKGLNYNTEEDYELTGGDRNFNVKEIEVYEVIAQ